MATARPDLAAGRRLCRPGSQHHYIQPLLVAIAHSFAVPESQIGLIVTATQLGFAFGLLLLVPLGDAFDRRMLISGTLLVLTLALVAVALAPITALAGRSFHRDGCDDCRNADDRAVCRTNLYVNGRLGAWDGPHSANWGPLGSPPTAADADRGTVEAFWRGTDGYLWHGTLAGSPIGGPWQLKQSGHLK